MVRLCDLTKEEINQIHVFTIKRYLQLEFPKGNKRRTDKEKKIYFKTYKEVTCRCKIPIPVTENNLIKSGVICQTCKLPIFFIGHNKNGSRGSMQF